MKNFVIILSFILLVSGCVSTTHLKLVATENNKEFLLDGEVAMTSKKDNSIVTIRFNNFPRDTVVKDGEKTYLLMSVKNLSKKEFVFRPSEHIKILRVSDKELAHIPKYKDLLEKQIQKEKEAQVLTGVTAALSGLSGGYDNTYALQSSDISRRGGEQRAFLRNLIKPSTLTPNFMLTGLVAFQMPELPDDKSHSHFIKVKVGKDTHLFSYTQVKAK